MSTKSSTFLSDRVAGDCRPNVDLAVLYTGTTNAVPTVEKGVLIFNGALANASNGGIGALGPGQDYRIEYDSILPGGAGVKYHCNLTATKPKLRFRFKDRQCGQAGETISLWLKPISTCQAPYEHEWLNPAYASYQCSSSETACQQLEWLAREVNRIYGDFATATVVAEDSTYSLYVEHKFDGGFLYVESSEGLTEPSIVTPYSGIRNLTLEVVQDWFPGTTVFTGTATVLSAIELTARVMVNAGPEAGQSTSDISTEVQTKVPVNQKILVLFIPGNTNSQAAYTELGVLLKGPASSNTANKFIAKLATGEDVCADQIFYTYTVTKTDAGDAAALADVKSDYTASAKQAIRVARIDSNTKSVYEIYTLSASAPAADGSDVVAVGSYVVPDATFTTICPPGTPCVDCIS